jgi:hypothetical protein
MTRRAVYDQGGHLRPSGVAKDLLPVATTGGPAEDALPGAGDDAPVREDREGIHDSLQGLGREQTPVVPIICDR